MPRRLCHLRPDGDLAPGAGRRGARRLWPYTVGWRHPLRRRPEDVDPVNLLVLGLGPAAVMKRLRDAGWRDPQEGGLHVVWMGGWRPVPMAGHLERGEAGRRDHLRVWRLGPHTLAGVHREVRGPGGRGHRVVAWDAARDAAAADLVRTGLRVLPPSPPITRPGLRGLDADGRMARLRPPPG